MESPDTPVIRAGLQAALSSAVDDIKSYVREQVFDAETKLLRAFASSKTMSATSMQPVHSDWLWSRQS